MNLTHLLNQCQDRVNERAEKESDLATQQAHNSNDFLKYRYRADGLYIALGVLTAEERRFRKTLSCSLCQEPITPQNIAFIQNKPHCLDCALKNH